MTPSELLGALHSFEIQQPEVAESKKDGLLKHYGFSEKDLKYFDEHMNEQDHISYGKYLKEEFADEEEFNKGFERGSELFFKNLNLFM
jgi:pyrroloquinoline quinone (PQQ) biosynthesis protein C